MEEGRTHLLKWTPSTDDQRRNIWTAWTRAEKIYTKVQENNHESRQKIS